MASPVACLSDSSLDGSIISSLDALRTKFFSALQDGAAALMDFNSSWGQFNDHFLGHHDELEDETRSLVYYFQVTVESVTGSLLDLPSGDELLGELSKELEDAIQAEEDEALSSRNTHKISHIELSSSWLCDHISNPYPSAAIRDSIASKSGAARRDVDAWFVDARKRMGWNDIRKKWFSNRRADTVAAATSFLDGPEEKCKLDDLCKHELSAMETKTRTMFLSKVKESELATKLDSAVRDKSASRVSSHGKRAKADPRPVPRPQSAYPTPDRSPRSLPQAAILDSPPTESRKRSSREDDEEEDVEDGHSHKRRKSNAADDFTCPLPSPSRSPIQLAATPIPESSGPLTNEQRLSTEHEQAGADLFASLVSASQGIVSTSLSQDWSLESFSLSTAMPNPVTDTPLDPNENLDIQLCDFNASGTSSYMMPNTLSQQDLFDLFSQAPSDLETTATNSNAFADLSSSLDFNQFSSDPVTDLISPAVMGGTWPPSTSYSTNMSGYPGMPDMWSDLSSSNLSNPSIPMPDMFFAPPPAPAPKPTALVPPTQATSLSELDKLAKRQELLKQKLAIEAQLDALA